MIAESKRLRIEPLHEENWNELLSLDSDEKVMRYIHNGATRNEAEVKAYVSRALEFAEMTGIGGYFTLWEKEEERFVGWVCLRPENEKGLSYELGYRLLPEFWGTGYATEAALAMMKKGFLEWEVPEIFAIAYGKNRGSVRIMEKVGLRFETIINGNELRYGIDRGTWIMEGNSLTSLGVRVSVKAIIEQDGKILLTKNGDQLEGPYYLLPGGGQEKKETIAEALRRECMEELGVRVEVGSFAVIREYIGENHEFAAWDQEFHQVEIMFACELLEEPVTSNILEGDVRQIGFEWIPLENLFEIRLYPKALAAWLNGNRTLQYLGDVN